MGPQSFTLPEFCFLFLVVECDNPGPKVRVRDRERSSYQRQLALSPSCWGMPIEAPGETRGFRIVTKNVRGEPFGDPRQSIATTRHTAPNS
jgi:hypothetical protein